MNWIRYLYILCLRIMYIHIIILRHSIKWQLLLRQSENRFGLDYYKKKVHFQKYGNSHMEIRSTWIFALAPLAPIHRVSICIDTNSSESKRFFMKTVNSWPIEAVMTWRSDSTISIILQKFSTIGFTERGTFSTLNFPEQNLRNQNCAWLAVTVSGP